MNSNKACWDAGAQESVMNAAWKSEKLPEAQITPIRDLLSNDNLLDFKAIS